MLDPRLPVLVGVGEVVRRPGDDGPAEPAQLMARAARAAIADACAHSPEALLGRIGALAAVPSVAWPDGDPGRRVADVLGVWAPTLRSSMQGGNGPQLLVNALAERIQAGRLDAALLCGAESLSTASRLLAQGEAPAWPPADPERRAGEILEHERPASTSAETEVGLIAPIVVYPLIENALRVASGRSAAHHLEAISQLWARFSEVAADHPSAWSRERHTADFLRTPSARNRLVTLPYTKLLNANIQVDQAAALVLCSLGTASALGVPADRWVFLHAGASAVDEWFVSHRPSLHRSPAIEACGRAIFQHAGTSGDGLGPVDLYSCFPSAVELAAAELGLATDDPARPLTCTGGLTFFGGPGNNYATHGIAAVARRLREGAPGELGLSTALGWYATKHALGLYGNRPPDRPFAALRPDPGLPTPCLVAEPGAHEATAETCTVIYERDGSPSHGILFARLADGRRALGATNEADVLAARAADDFLGSPVRLGPDRHFTPA